MQRTGQSTGETYDFKTRTRKPPGSKKDPPPPKRAIEPPVQSPEQRKRPGPSRNPSPIVAKKPAKSRPDERTNEIELPSVIRPHMEPSEPMTILGLGGLDPPKKPAGGTVPTPYKRNSIFSPSGRNPTVGSVYFAVW